MSKFQSLKIYMEQRLTAAVDDILGHFERTMLEYEEETERRHRDYLGVILAAETKHQITGFSPDLQQLLTETKDTLSEQQQLEESTAVDLEDAEPEPLNIKIEEAETNMTMLKLSHVYTKTEDEKEEPQSSQLQHRQTDKTVSLDGEDGGRLEQDTSDVKPKLKVRVEDRRVTQKPYSRQNHGISLNDTRSNSRNLYRCSECGKIFSSPSYLKLHIRCHTGERPFRCPICRKSFSWKGRMQKHVRIHTGEKPFRCSVCGKMFSENGNLKVHMRIHTGEKPFTCSICGKAYAQRGNMKSHMMVHKGETIVKRSVHQPSKLTGGESAAKSDVKF
uniref:C2H2-type domain-containing protein n=1 Tax=Nothobranchius korthausae TaxID=1143690 RepID=A0A1A8H6M1_9TELE